MLTARQKLLLEAIIKEFIDTAEAVGSLNIGDKYDLDVSPATIRNEMALLSELGLLSKHHSSSGRVPTTEAIKWFVDEALDTYQEPDTLVAAAIKERIFQLRFNLDQLLNEAVQALYNLSNNTALVVFNERRYTAGISALLENSEYHDLIKLKRVFALMEDYRTLSQLFEHSETSRDVKVLIGEETGIDQFTDYAVAFAPIKLHGSDHGYISVIGPNRMNYARVIPAIKYIVSSLEEAVAGW